MNYTLTLVSSDDVGEADRRAAEQRYRRALDEALGGASLVLPTSRAWLGIVARQRRRASRLPANEVVMLRASVSARVEPAS